MMIGVVPIAERGVDPSRFEKKCVGLPSDVKSLAVPPRASVAGFQRKLGRGDDVVAQLALEKYVLRPDGETRLEIGRCRVPQEERGVAEEVQRIASTSAAEAKLVGRLLGDVFHRARARGSKRHRLVVSRNVRRTGGRSGAGLGGGRNTIRRDD